MAGQDHNGGVRASVWTHSKTRAGRGAAPAAFGATAEPAAGRGVGAAWVRRLPESSVRPSGRGTRSCPRTRRRRPRVHLRAAIYTSPFLPLLDALRRLLDGRLPRGRQPLHHGVASGPAPTSTSRSGPRPSRSRRAMFNYLHLLRRAGLHGASPEEAAQSCASTSCAAASSSSTTSGARSSGRTCASR